jgi:hypothetical protein
LDLTFHTSSGSIGITWDDARLNDFIMNLFTPWQGNSSLPLYQIEIKQKGSEYLLIAPHDTISCTHSNDLFTKLEYTLTQLFQDIFEQNLLIHASCVDKEGNGALFIGPHGIGKTTLALTAISSGLRALTDDLAIINESHQVIGFPRPFKVLRDIWNFEPSVVPSNCHSFACSNEMKYLNFYEPSVYYSEGTNLKHLIFPSRGNKTTRIVKMGETEALERLLTQGFNFNKRKNTIVGELIELLRVAPPIELQYDDHWDAIERVKNIL